MNDKVITNDVPAGEHIALYCVNHPDLRWSTKNISHIGARTIFFDLYRECTDAECSCPASDLRPVIGEL